MTRKHYRQFASVIADARAKSQFFDGTPAPTPQLERERTINDLMTRIADIFAHDNFRFDRDKFIDACYK